MTLREHADRTEKIVGIRAEDIHAWIDEFFDMEGFTDFLQTGKTDGFDPYNHRQFRHCYEALQDAFTVFAGKYTKDQIKDVFECHIKDDYNGYIPFREDFANGRFKEKYHEHPDHMEHEAILSRQEFSEYFKGKSYLKNKKASHTISRGFLFNIVLPTFSAIILFVTSIFFIIIPLFKNNMMEQKTEIIQELTNTSINYYLEQEKKGVLSHAAAQQAAAHEIEKMSYGMEVEMNLLIKKLSIISGIISGVLIIILIYILLQSLKYEHERSLAESGLIEAKDRYRALVDASSEGYLLEVAGKTIFSNNALQTMLGYSQEELASRYLWELLPANHKINHYAIDFLKRLYKGKVTSHEFEAQIETKHSGIIDVIITTSNIFFSQKNGHAISVKQIKDTKTERIYTNFGNFDVQTFAGSYPAVKDESRSQIIHDIQSSESIGQVITAINTLPALINTMTIRGSRPGILKATIGSVYNASVVKFIDVSILELGVPPVSFAFLSLGSNARHEMTLFSDQDNAIIFDDVEGRDYEATKNYFVRLGEHVSSKLHQAGYHYCPGGIMASNPQWCLSRSQWYKQFSRWITNPIPDSLLKINVFCDMECTYGNNDLVNELKDVIYDVLDDNPNFFIHYANNCLLYKPPLTMLGAIKAEKRSGVKIINVKECIKPLENLVRIYTLKHKIRESGTLSRLTMLREKGVFPENRFREIMYVFDYLWNLRFYNQIVLNNDLKKINDDLDLNNLTDIEVKNLRNILSKITVFHTKLSFDFLGKA